MDRRMGEVCRIEPFVRCHLLKTVTQALELFGGGLPIEFDGNPLGAIDGDAKH